MYDASSRKDIRRAEKAQKQIEGERIEFIRAALSTRQGRTWFHQLLSFCHIFADPFTGNALLEAHSKGERNVGLMVYNDVVVNCPDEFVQMMREAQIKEITDERRDTDRDPSEAGDDASSEQSGSED